VKENDRTRHGGEQVEIYLAREGVNLEPFAINEGFPTADKKFIRNGERINKAIKSCPNLWEAKRRKIGKKQTTWDHSGYICRLREPKTVGKRARTEERYCKGGHHDTKKPKRVYQQERHERKKGKKGARGGSQDIDRKPAVKRGTEEATCQKQA